MQLKALCLFSIPLPLFHLHYYKCIQDKVIKERKLCFLVMALSLSEKNNQDFFAGGIELPLTLFSWEWLVKTE